jgi:hypothetical protein
MMMMVMMMMMMMMTMILHFHSPIMLPRMGLMDLMVGNTVIM